MTLITHTWGTGCHHKTKIFRANMCTKFDASILGHFKEIYLGVNL